MTSTPGGQAIGYDAGIEGNLETQVRELAEELGVPGVSVGVFHEEQERYAYHGVTNVENPLPVDGSTLFQFGSTGKTFTSVAMLRLVDDDKVDLDAPVRTYVPELRLADEEAAATVTVLQLLNHTAGWFGDDFTDTGDGDDAIARYVAHMAELRQLAPPGRIVSYNNASLSLAGRVIENVTGQTFERVITELVLDPVGLKDTLFFPNDIMTRRFVVGHRKEEDGTLRVLRPWAMARSSNPMGGRLSATAPDQVRWARFHLDLGRTQSGTQLVSPALIGRMQEPTVESVGSFLGDAVGISWLLRDVGGTRVVSHGGSTNGQYGGFTMVPAHRFAVVSLTNGEPYGPVFNRRIAQWALEHFLGLVASKPVPAPRNTDALAPYAGRYEDPAIVFEITADGDHLRMEYEPTAQLIGQLGEDADYREPPVPLRMLSDSDRWIVTEGSSEGERGFFTRDPDTDRVTGIHTHGRFVPRA
jgi:CubicO group peptidase (beta-lactamase class C family)